MELGTWLSGRIAYTLASICASNSLSSLQGNFCTLMYCLLGSLRKGTYYFRQIDKLNLIPVVLPLFYLLLLLLPLHPSLVCWLIEERHFFLGRVWTMLLEQNLHCFPKLHDNKKGESYNSSDLYIAHIIISMFLFGVLEKSGLYPILLKAGYPLLANLDRRHIVGALLSLHPIGFHSFLHHGCLFYISKAVNAWCSISCIITQLIP